MANPKAAGFLTWWNQYGSAPIETCIQRVKQLGAQGGGGVITKAGYWTEFEMFKAAGVRVGVERYAYPSQPFREAQMLAAGIARGAEFAVVNAEVEWEQQSAAPMEQLVFEFQRTCPGVELYGCTDTRGGRLSLPYQQVLLRYAAGMMPMIYPGAFQQTAAAAFAAALDRGQDFRGVPVLPAIQTYGGVGGAMVDAQLNEVKRRGLPGCQAYTVAHANDAEWEAFVVAVPAAPAAPAPAEEESMAKLLRYGRRDGSRLVWTAHTFVSDGFRVRHVTDPEPLKELQAAGVWPEEITLVSGDAIRQLEGGAAALTGLGLT